MTLLDIAEQPIETSKKSRTAQVADYFKARPGQWIDGLVFESFAGRYAWRSRISDCRKQLAMNIENRQRHVGDGVVVSEYRYVPGEGK